MGDIKLLAGVGSPNQRDAIRGKLAVWRHHVKGQHFALSKNDAIKGILVMGRQFGGAKEGLSGQGQFRQSPPGDLIGPPLPGRIGKRKFACAMLERDLPERRMADMEHGSRIIDGSGRRPAQLRGFTRQPDERAGVQKQVTSNPSAFMPASSSAENDASVQRTGPEVMTPTCGRPMLAGAGNGTIRATGFTPSCKTTSSPCTTRRRSWAK